MEKDKITQILIGLQEFRKETKEKLSSLESHLDSVEEKIDELKSSANALDNVLEQYPIERIKRLEKHNHLPVFTPVNLEE